MSISPTVKWHTAMPYATHVRRVALPYATIPYATHVRIRYFTEMNAVCHLHKCVTERGAVTVNIPT